MCTLVGLKRHYPRGLSDPTFGTSLKTALWFLYFVDYGSLGNFSFRCKKSFYFDIFFGISQLEGKPSLYRITVRRSVYIKTKLSKSCGRNKLILLSYIQVDDLLKHSKSQSVLFLFCMKIIA